MINQLAPIHHRLVEESASGYIFQLTYWSLTDVSYSDECWMKKAFQCLKNVAALCAVEKFCSTNRLFNM